MSPATNAPSRLRTAIGVALVIAVAAPGDLCADHGFAQFVPSKPADTSEGWAGEVERAEVIKTPWPVSMVRNGGDGTVQFAVQRPAHDVRRILEPHLRVDG